MAIGPRKSSGYIVGQLGDGNWEADDVRLMRFLYSVAPKRSFDFLTVRAAIGRKRKSESSIFSVLGVCFAPVSGHSRDRLVRGR